MPENPYNISGTDCLKNKLGLTDSKVLADIESDIVGWRASQLADKPLPGKIDYSYLKTIHKALFQDVYEWAGKERDFQTMKNGLRFEYPHNINNSSDKLFAELAKENNLSDLDRSDFIKRSSHYFGELNAIHPFPEGNGRSQRILFDKIGKDAGFEFDWDKVKKVEYINAVIHSLAIDTSKLEDVFEKMVVEIEKEVTLQRSTDIVYSIDNPISKREYNNAKEIVDKEKSDINKNLLSTPSINSVIDGVKAVAVNRELRIRVPDELQAVKSYESNQQANALLSQLKNTDRLISKAIKDGDEKAEKQGLRKKATILNKLVNRKSIAKTLPPSLKNAIKAENNLTTKSLSLHRSKGHER